MQWFYSLRHRANGTEWSGRYSGDQSAVWELGAQAEVRARLAVGKEPWGEYVLHRYRDTLGRRGSVTAEVNVIAIS